MWQSWPWWKVLLKAVEALTEFWRTRAESAAQEEVQRRIEVLNRERQIDEEVAGARQQEEAELDRRGHDASAYLDAFQRVRDLQRG